jgi:glutathione S-transferase
MPGSLYTAKARSYLRRQCIAFEEVPPSDARFADYVLPRINRWIIPVLELPDGILIQDTEAIIDHVESNRLATVPAIPENGVMETLARIIDLFGGEGLLRPAMHYRWSFDAENLPFLRADFLSALAPDAEGEMADGVFGMASGRMRAVTQGLGVNASTVPLIEQSYCEFLGLFEAHLATVRYVLGDRPTLADYGLIGPLFAHLARDPAPSLLMKQRAPGVWRWVERMNAPGGNTEKLFMPGEMPPTLIALLQYIAAEYVPEVASYVSAANAWLKAQACAAPSARAMPRVVATTTMTWRGAQIPVAVMPYRLWMLQRVQDSAARLGPDDRAMLAGLLERCGLNPLLDLVVARRVERVGHLEVFAAK